MCFFFFFFSSRRRHTRCSRDWSSDVCSSDLETITLAEKDIETFPEVQSATYVSEDSALGRARGELVEFRDVLQELERNPLPASIEVKLTPRFRDAEHVNEVAERLCGFGFVDDVRF